MSEAASGRSVAAADALEERLRALARTPVLLVGCDYDGTIAPLVDDPSRAVAHPDARKALQLLSELAHTHVAVISGRSLRDLAAISSLTAPIHLVGSHGSEFDVGVAIELDPVAKARLDSVRHDIERVAETHAGIRLEHKPASIAVHYRTCDAETAHAVVQAIAHGPAARDGIYVKHGKLVIELAVVPGDKGASLEKLRQHVGASAAVYLGDDLTDEDAFATLHGPDVGVYVGHGSSIAQYRVGEIDDVVHLLAFLYEERAKWVRGAAAVPIDHHSLLSDGRNVALVDDHGRLAWLCLPRPDSASVFGSLLGGDEAGAFSIAPVGDHRAGQSRYLDNTMMVETTWPGVSVFDFLVDNGAERGGHHNGIELVRAVEADRSFRVRFAPRPDFAQATAELDVLRDQDGSPIGLETRGGAAPLWLHAPGVEWELTTVADQAVAEAVVPGGLGRHEFTLIAGPTRSIETLSDASQRAEVTRQAWAEWADRLSLPQFERELVVRSALTLKALCYHPTGAFLAAATTSLPAHYGGARNWDYRYSWLRDGAMSARTLVRLGSIAEAHEFVAWLWSIIEREPDADRLEPLYSVLGHGLGVEATLPHLSGYAGSRPVRVGNAAQSQVQLDVFGSVLELLESLSDTLAPGEFDKRHWHIAELLVQAVERRWHEPDHGIWEARRPPRHHVHSKVMCWTAVDRAIKIGQRHGLAVPEHWFDARAAIADDVLTHGWSDRVNSYVVAYGDDDLDAAVLQIILTGLLPAADPRADATVRAVDMALRDGAVVMRYRYDDGLAGHDAGFHICTGWLIESMAALGRHDEARELFKHMTSLGGPTGLFSEGYDVASGRALGNFPQAYSHLALVNCALALDH